MLEKGGNKLNSTLALFWIRYLVAGASMKWSEMIDRLRAIYPDNKQLPTAQAPGHSGRAELFLLIWSFFFLCVCVAILLKLFVFYWNETIKRKRTCLWNQLRSLSTGSALAPTFDCSKAKRELNWEPTVSADDMLRDQCEAFLASKWRRKRTKSKIFNYLFLTRFKPINWFMQFVFMLQFID